MAVQGAPRFLLTFDFDETIVDENSDDSIVRAAPGQRLPESLRATYREGFYNEYMQRVFKYLGEQGVRPRDLRAVYEAIPLSPGMGDLLQFVAKQGTCFEVILISDANTFGVESSLRAAGHLGLFRRILSNPSGPDARGLLTLRPFHTHSCPRCPANMCKHKVLSDYLHERAQDGVHFERLFYVGDGANDFCPMGLLASGDVAFPRRGYPMHRLIQEAQKAEPSSFRASVVPWETATEIRLHLQQGQSLQGGMAQELSEKELLRMEVEQLKKEVRNSRAPISKTGKEIKDYVEAQAGNDPLLKGIPEDKNPFKEKGACRIS